jgi:hypothetical protein
MGNETIHWSKNSQNLLYYHFPNQFLLYTEYGIHWDRFALQESSKEDLLLVDGCEVTVDGRDRPTLCLENGNYKTLRYNRRFK